MSVSETTYAFEVHTPQFLERARQQVVKLVARTLDGELAAPASGTYTLYDASETAQVDAQAVTVTASVANYTVTAATLPTTLALSANWREQWALVMPDGTTRTVRRQALLCLRLLYPVVSYADLLKRHRTLGDILPPTDKQAEVYIADAWTSIQNKLIAQGRRPHLIMSSEVFRDPHIALTFDRIFTDAQTSFGEGRYAELASDYRAEFKALWSELNFVYDDDESGAEDAETRRAATTSVWLSKPPRYL